MDCAKYARDLLEEDNERASFALSVRKTVRMWPPDFLDVLHQGYRDRISIEDAYMIGLIWGEVVTGNVLATKIHIGTKPSSNDSLEENQEKFTQAQQRAEGGWSFCLRCAAGEDDDGHIYLPRGTQSIASPEWGACSRLENRYVPLEVGSTHAGNLWFHLTTAGGFARWPYGGTCLHVWTLIKPIVLG